MKSLSFFFLSKTHTVRRGVSLRKSQFDPRAVDVGFVVDKVASRQASFGALRSYRIIIIPPVPHNDIYSPNIDAI
jgi:hypothetical protein